MNVFFYKDNARNKCVATLVTDVLPKVGDRIKYAYADGPLWAHSWVKAIEWEIERGEAVVNIFLV